jgi:hypothetical protein
MGARLSNIVVTQQKTASWPTERSSTTSLVSHAIRRYNLERA